MHYTSTHKHTINTLVDKHQEHLRLSQNLGAPSRTCATSVPCFRDVSSSLRASAGPAACTLLWTPRCVCSPGLLSSFHEELKHIVHDENISVVKKSLLQTHIRVENLQTINWSQAHLQCARVLSGYVCVVVP